MPPLAGMAGWGSGAPLFVYIYSRSNPKASTHLKIEKNENMRAPAAQNRARLPATVLYSLMRRPQRLRPHQHIRIHAHTSDGMPLSER